MVSTPTLPRARSIPTPSRRRSKRDHVRITAALYGEITLKDGRVEQSNLHDYQILRMNPAPTVEVHIVESRESPGGMGEAGNAA